MFDDYANDAFRGATRAIETFLVEQGPTLGDHGPLFHKMYFASKSRT